MSTMIIPAVAPLRLPLKYRLYLFLLKVYSTSNKSLINFLLRPTIEWSIRLATNVFAAASSFRFPSRATGGWWWIWRYRFEMLAGWYEYPTTLWIHRLIRPGMIAVDVGAHIGYFTRTLSHGVGPSGKVFAFEPSPENYEVLLQNTARRIYGNITCVPVAIADQAGQAPLYVSPGHSNHSLIAGYIQSEASIQVETFSLDQFVHSESVDHVDIIKIDAEGAEPRILRGMTGTLANNPNVALFVEINPRALHAAGFSPVMLIELIESFGFIAGLIMPDSRIENPRNQPIEATSNLLCLIPERWNSLLLH